MSAYRKFIAARQGLYARLALVCGGLALWLYLIALVTAIMAGDGLRAPGLELIGGDFLAFDTAAEAAAQGQAVKPYDAVWFKSALAQRSGIAEPAMMWQYPPHFYLLTAPLALIGYLPGYGLWLGLSIAAFAGTAAAMGEGRRAIAMMIATPVTMSVINQGQASFLFAALLLAAAFFADRRPVLAGIAAGLLTMKPQLGVLLPVVYLAGGHWRAFFSAGITAAVLVAVSLVAFGTAPWAEFFASVLRLEADFTGAGAATPVTGMTTPLAALLLYDAPVWAARAVHVLIALALGVLCGAVWRRGGPADLRTGLVAAAAVLVTPYAYSYDLTLILYPCAVIARRAAQEGWRPGEIEALAGGWFGLLLARSLPLYEVVPLAFLAAAACLALVIRRYFASVSSASACSSPPMRPFS